MEGKTTAALGDSPGLRAARVPLVAGLIGLTSLMCLLVGCKPGGRLPDKSSPGYAEYVASFYVGLAALQVGDDVRAESSLSRATELVAGEPAGWANWGILALRQRNFDAAGQRFDKAVALDEKDDRLAYLQGLLESDRGNSAAAIGKLRRAAELNPKNLRAIYQLAGEVERQGDEHSEADFEGLMQQVLAVEPGNLAALVELCRIAAKRGDGATLRMAVGRIVSQSGVWPAEVKAQLTALQGAAGGAEPRAAATRSIFLRNVLMRVPEFRANLAELKAQPGEEAQPFTRFVRLETPEFRVAGADAGLGFMAQAVGSGLKGAVGNDWVGAVSLEGTGAPAVVAANGREVRISTEARMAFPGGVKAEGVSAEGVLAVDFNYDFKMDLVLAGGGGVRFWRQDGPGAFTDVTGKTKLPTAVVNGAYAGAWAVDIEADGDLDVVVGAREGAPLVLRNNGDGTFAVTKPFAGVVGLRQLVWADWNGDGNPDAAMVDGAGRLHVFLNERLGNFREVAGPVGTTGVKAIAGADVDHAGPLGLVVVGLDGVVRSCRLLAGGGWEVGTLATVLDAARRLAGEVRLKVADLDNNGAFDLVLSSAAGAAIWLQGADGSFQLLGAQTGAVRVMDVADVGGDGRLDLLALGADGGAMELVNKGTKSYHWQTIRPRARQTTGDQRVNSFGVGGEIEIRAGLMVQKQTIAGPELHFGLGTQAGVDVARIVWPNGSVRAEFGLKVDQPVMTEQRLKGSCPFLFAYNGKGMEFVKDTVPWGSAIGLRISALGTARVEATEEWYKIGRDELVARDGVYDLRITGELWETYYYDSLRLMAVDHPAGTEVFTDERFKVPAVKLAVTAVDTPQAIARATDDRGEDVTAVVRALDGRYLDTFGRGQYQGVTRDHYVEIDLGEKAGKVGVDEPLWLIARGWLHPSDSSINVAMGQGGGEHAKPLSLEVPDGHGGWKVARANLGFPAGRKKNCLIDLTGVFVAGTARKVRLRTNLEVYWDAIEWAVGRPDVALKVTQLAAETADLHYRGYSVIRQANASSPEVPQYNELAATTQIWRDLAGYYTRYGDVRELLAGSDDRYVIMNAGDELSLRFRAPAAPAAGWVRDYVIAGDGWIKDGDYNSTYSKTVLPYPYHARREYGMDQNAGRDSQRDEALGRVEDEWVYRHYGEDWQKYQTRYVTPRIFEDALRSGGSR